MFVFTPGPGDPGKDLPAVSHAWVWSVEMLAPPEGVAVLAVEDGVDEVAALGGIESVGVGENSYLVCLCVGGWGLRLGGDAPGPGQVPEVFQGLPGAAVSKSMKATGRPCWKTTLFGPGS